MTYRRLLNVAKIKVELEVRNSDAISQRTAEVIAAIHNYSGFGSPKPITANQILGKETSSSGSGGVEKISPDEVGDLIDEIEGNS